LPGKLPNQLDEFRKKCQGTELCAQALQFGNGRVAMILASIRNGW
jgi:hypothetical protein